VRTIHSFIPEVFSYTPSNPPTINLLNTTHLQYACTKHIKRIVMCKKGRAAAPPGIGCKTGVSTSRYPASLKKLRMALNNLCDKRFFT
jgi:hypothetical protein